MWCVGVYTEWFACKVSFTVQLKDNHHSLVEDTVILTTAVLIGM
jgi:hypothetical protein